MHVKISEALKGLLREGEYKSAARHRPHHPASPDKEGGPYLKHIGLLGAAQPTIFGLGEEGAEGFLIVSFSEKGSATKRVEQEMETTDLDSEVE